MPVELLEPNTHIRLSARPGLGPFFNARVEASAPVETLLLDQDGLRAFEEGRLDAARDHRRAGRRCRPLHDLSAFVLRRCSDRWYFLIVNWSDKPVAVHWALGSEVD